MSGPHNVLKPLIQKKTEIIHKNCNKALGSDHFWAWLLQFLDQSTWLILDLIKKEKEKKFAAIQLQFQD